MLVPWNTDLRAAPKSREQSRGSIGERVVRNAFSHHDDDDGSRAVQPSRFQHTQCVSPSAGDPNPEAMS
jgi:hypothetical protein